ncbi:MAG: hypothetical protein ACR2P1_15255 [Pseudomonadales bacterium]
MTGTLTLILTAAMPWVFALIIVSEHVRRKRLQVEKLQQRLQHLERRELAANNAAQDMRAQLLQLQNSVAHSQRVLMNNLTGSGRSSSPTNTLSASRDERKLRDMLPL